MNSKELLNKYYAHVKKEGLIKSLLCALIVGFSALAVTALACWFAGFKAVWIAAIVFVAVTGASFAIFYFIVFRFSVERAAKRADAAGLEERIITMTELEGDNSYIAQRQREDALQVFASVSDRITKFAVPVALIIVVGVSAVTGGALTTVAALSATDQVPPIVDLIDPTKPGDSTVDPLNPQYELTFEAYADGKIDNGGIITGDILQIVSKDELPTTVYAEADLDYAFAGWFDSLDWMIWVNGSIAIQEDLYYESLVCKTPDFTPDFNTITEDTVFYALFVIPQEGEDGDQPSDEGGEPGKPSRDHGNQDSDEPSDPNDPNGEKGEDFQGDKIVDGETDYGDALSGNEGDVGGVIGGYFGTIGK